MRFQAYALAVKAIDADDLDLARRHLALSKTEWYLVDLPWVPALGVRTRARRLSLLDLTRVIWNASPRSPNGV
jgi:hypothetical protein